MHIPLDQGVDELWQLCLSLSPSSQDQQTEKVTGPCQILLDRFWAPNVVDVGN